MSIEAEKKRAPRNRTLVLTAEERSRFEKMQMRLDSEVGHPREIRDCIICQDIFRILDLLPVDCVDLLFLDPPYNQDKTFGAHRFKGQSTTEYAMWLESWLPKLCKTLKSTATVYICGDWRSSAAIQLVAEKHLKVRNRITWEREKGRGATANWKNCAEDIWFCTMSDEYTFHVDAVKLKRKVIAPYTNDHGQPKDWDRTDSGNFRLTYPSNLWTDLTIPFWSMTENTDHPTQKPEKMLAKIILASTNPGDFVLDPFLGSGTAAVVAKKLERHFCGVEIDSEFACLALKRLELAVQDAPIQGYADGVFWERNTLSDQKSVPVVNAADTSLHLFEVAQHQRGKSGNL